MAEDRYVTITNLGSTQLLVGAKYLGGGASRRVHRAIAEAAKAKHGDSLKISGEAEAGPAAPTPPSTEADDLTKLEGIGPRRAEQLQEIGISSFSDLANSEAGWLTDQVDWLNMTQAQGLIVQAKLLVEENAD